MGVPEYKLSAKFAPKEFEPIYDVLEILYNTRICVTFNIAMQFMQS